MKSPVCLLLAALLAAPLASLAATGKHEHGAAPQKMASNAGKRWATDEPLRQGMNAIRSSASAILPLAHAGKASNAAYDAFAREVSTRVAYIVQYCRLAPEADAQLHVAVGAIMAGAEMVEGKRKGANRAAGVDKVVQALNTYGTYFDHPDWVPLALPHSREQ